LIIYGTGEKLGGATSKRENSKAGETVQPSRTHAPMLDCALPGTFGNHHLRPLDPRQIIIEPDFRDTTFFSAKEKL